MPSTTTDKSRRGPAKAAKTKPAASKRRSGQTTATAKGGTTNGRHAIVNYQTALRWLHDHVDYERRRVVPYNNRTFSLERMRRVLADLGNPHQKLKCVQIAGTKGKGAACTMLASMLQECGYTTGLFTSPHLIELTERIAIDGQPIGRTDLVELFKLIAKKERSLGQNKPTFFEILTAAALRHFADQAVDVVILETGLGGRLDSTSVVTPMVTGMTQISLDHMNVLGNTIESIAREKAGVFKKNVPAFSVAQEPTAMNVLDQFAAEAETKVEVTGREIEFSYRFEASRDLGPHTRVCVATETSRWDHLAVPLRGEHQALNCGLALAIIDKLKAYGFNVPEERIIEGLDKTQLPGRMEQVWDEPRIIIDGAHNAASITALIRALGAHINYDSLVVIFGCGQDKDTPGMLRELALGADKIIFTQARSNPRANPPEELLNIFTEISGKMTQSAPTLDQAIQLAGHAVSREDLIVITGSFYLVGEARKRFLNRAAKRRQPQVSKKA